MAQVKFTRTWRPRRPETRVAEVARRTAEHEAARIPWPQLQKAREDYVAWEAVALWVRAIEGTEGDFPDWLARAVARRSPGFSEFVVKHIQEHPDSPPSFWYHLERWINERIFGQAWREGWMNAVGYYAARDLASLRNHAYWEHCERQWKPSKPAAYPSFREWLKASEHCSDRALDECEMPDEKRRLIKLSQRVSPRTLCQAVERYLEWEVFAYWTRTALEIGSALPGSVEKQVKKRCPGFLETNGVTRAANRGEGSHCQFNRLIKWIEDYQFAGAQKHGWFDVLLYQAHIHPRHARVIDYWHDWEAGWAKHPTAKYPRFKTWRDAADCYTFEPDES